MNFELSYTAAETLPADSTERKIVLKYLTLFPNELLLTVVMSVHSTWLSKLNLLIIWVFFFHLFIKNCCWCVSDKKSISFFTHLVGVKMERRSPAVKLVLGILTTSLLPCMKSTGAWIACRVCHWTLVFCSLLVSLNMQGSQRMLEYRVYVELPVTLDVRFECYFFYLPLNLKCVWRCSVVLGKIRILAVFSRLSISLVSSVVPKTYI